MSTAPAVEPSAPGGSASAAPAVARGFPARMILAIVVGAALAVFLGATLLTWALSLMFMLGLFFFMLFGLLIGAVMFRIAKPARPYASAPLWVASIIIALAGWGTAIYKEAADFPSDFAQRVMRNAQVYKLYIPQGKYHEVEADVRNFITRHLAEKYPPGGCIGYYKLAASGAAVHVELANQFRTFDIPAAARWWVWWIRVALAPVLMALAVRALIDPLKNATDPVRPKKV